MSDPARGVHRIVGIVAACVLSAGCPAFAPDFGEFGGERLRSLRDRAAQRNAIVELRLDTLLGARMRSAGVDCWIVVSEEASADPLFSFLTVSGTRAVGKAVLLLCQRDGRLERTALGMGLEANAAFYELIDVGADADLGTRLRERLVTADPVKIVVNRSAALPIADGLSGSADDWLRAAIGEKYASRLESSAPLVEQFFGQLLDVEQPLFVEAVRLTDAILAEVLSDQVIVAAGTSRRDLEWAVRERALRAGVALAFEPFVLIYRRGEELVAGPQTGSDPILQPGDLVYLAAGASYLGYATRLGRWAYLLETGETTAPEWATAGLENLAVQLEEMAGRVVPGLAQAEAIEAARRATDGDLDVAVVGRLGYLPEGPAEPFGVPLRVWSPEVVVEEGSALALSVASTVPAWDGQRVTLLLMESALVTEAGSRLAVPVQTTPFLID